MRPLTILPGDTHTGPRIGGPCPLGLEAELRDDATQYFGTFPLPGDATREFSLFHRFDRLGADPERDVITFNNQILAPSDLIWVVVHERSTRSPQVRSAFGGHSLAVGAAAPDRLTDDDLSDAPYSGSKLSGRCYVDRAQVRNEVLALEAASFVHLLQIVDAGPTYIAEFPWDPGSLNVWAADSQSPASYRFCIQQ